MVITKQSVAEKIASDLRYDVSLADLVSWAEDAVMDGEFDENETVRFPKLFHGSVWPMYVHLV